MPEANIQGQRIRLLRIALGMQQKELAQKAGISQSLLSDIETGKRQGTGVGVLYAIATALGVPITELLPELVGQDAPPTPALRELREVPVIGMVPGGAPQMVEQQGMGAIYVEGPVLANVRRPYALDVNGDSMLPGIHDGDFVVVDPDAIWAVGNVVVALVGNETTVKRIKMIDGRPMLAADNGHGIIDPAGQDVRIVGVVVWVQPAGWRP